MSYDPIMISKIRKTMPQTIAEDIIGVQPMQGPHALVFAMRTKYLEDQIDHLREIIDGL